MKKLIAFTIVSGLSIFAGCSSDSSSGAHDTEDSTTESSSSEQRMTPCEVVLSTGSGKGVSLATCDTVPEASADLIFSKTGTTRDVDVKVDCAAGTFITPIINGDDANYDDDYGYGVWPENLEGRGGTMAYVSDFKYGTISETSLNDMVANAGLLYVAKAPTYDAATGAGFYAFAITEKGIADAVNGDRTMKIKVYYVP